ncbi:adenine phosphoribosyltransferase-like [Salvelinus alpinus]|uniref:adenine phosphoribosyltransferase-like n=1 Tax=Salvelinus alpinus TaxID=8036 RepID=UPI0039FDCDA5
MGFILGSSVATTLGKGFLAIRKAGHLCIQIQSQEYRDYSGREKMEVHLAPGADSGPVDRDRRNHEGCYQTGGAAGSYCCVAAVAIENSEGGKWIKEKYKHFHCIPEELQIQIDKQYLDSFQELRQLNAQTQCHAVPSRVGNL